MAYIVRRAGCPLGEIETWIFDLDNTLYPASCNLFEQVQTRMNDYICARFSLSLEEAAELRRRYFLEHGTTMNGLMAVDRIDPHEFMDFVHEVDLACVPPNPALAEALEKLPGRKLVYTNGSVKHAENLLRHLGITHHFVEIFDIIASDFMPKPAMAPFRRFIERHEIVPQTALMVEDMAKNLVPAAELGMTTAWVPTGIDWATAASDADHINYVVEDLAGFLAAAVAEVEARR